jgi:hypothetical protein
LTVSKQVSEKSDGERFNLRKLKELEVRKQYQIKISKRFAAMVNLRDSENINRACENNKEDIKKSAKESLDLYELNRQKPEFDEEYLLF